MGVQAQLPEIRISLGGSALFALTNLPFEPEGKQKKGFLYEKQDFTNDEGDAYRPARPAAERGGDGENVCAGFHRG